MAAVVVGGGSGIGAAVVARQRAAGLDVLTWDLHGGDVHCDISDPASVDAAVATTLERSGVPSIVSITAGVGHGGMLLDAPAEDFDRVLGTNTKGVWLAMRALARPMLAGDGGSIVVTSSVSATLADRSMGLYCASKAALDMLVAVAAQEWAPAVRVNAVAPGVTDTPMLAGAPRDGAWLGKVARRTPLGRLGTPEDIAACLLAVHELSWLTGEVVRCDGGLQRSSPIAPLGG